VDEFFASLKRDVKIATDKAQKQLKALSEELLTEIDGYHTIYSKRLTEESKASLLAKHKAKLDVSQPTKFCNRWKECLARNQQTFEDRQYMEAVEEASNYKKVLLKHLKELNYLTTNHEKLQFIKNQKVLSSDCIGYLERKTRSAEKDESFVGLQSNAVVAFFQSTFKCRKTRKFASILIRAITDIFIQVIFPNFITCLDRTFKEEYSIYQVGDLQLTHKNANRHHS
jgi:hypothetical protein